MFIFEKLKIKFFKIYDGYIEFALLSSIERNEKKISVHKNEFISSDKH
jgi:hypothetical protein